jgi:hypothetical protein
LFAVTSIRMLVAVIGAAAFVALVALAAVSPPASANHSWENYHWGRTTTDPFTLKLGNNLNSSWKPFLDTASGQINSVPFSGSDWTDSSVLDTQVVSSQKDPRKCNPTSGRIEVCNAKYGNNGWLGLAQIWTSGGLIVQGTAKMNDSYFNTSKYNKPEWKNLVMCQEIGHTFGLAHVNVTYDTPNEGTCMDYTNSPSGPPSNQYPNQHDYAQLETIYSKTDSKTTVGNTSAATKMPPAANQGYFNSRAEWGALKQRSPDGGVEVYERDFGGGNKVHTRVIRVVEKTPPPETTGGNDDHHHDH